MRTQAVFLLFVGPIVTGGMFPAKAVLESCANAVDFTDPTYNAPVRLLIKPDGHEHNLYYYRNPFNADSSYLVGVQSDLNEENWRVVLYDGSGCYLRDLWTLPQYDWRLVWDRNDPDLLYTYTSTTLYRYHVSTGVADPLKEFWPEISEILTHGGAISLNQAGTRILVIGEDGWYRSYDLPNMTNERKFRPTYPPGDGPDADSKDRYVGYQNYIVVATASDTKTLIYTDTGELVNTFPAASGHSDFTPDGEWVHFQAPTYDLAFEVRSVSITASGYPYEVVFTRTAVEMAYVQSQHVSCPSRDETRCFISFFPSAGVGPITYAPPYDEVMELTLANGAVRYLARHASSYPPFWAEPLAVPNAEGTVISFNSNVAGTIDQGVLWVPAEASGGH